MHVRPKVTTKQHGRVARDGIACVSYIRAAVVSRLQEVDGQSKPESIVYPYRLSFVYRQCASELDR